MSPLMRSMAHLKDKYPLALVRKVEVWNAFAHKRQDLWGYDVLVAAPGIGFIFVQVTDDEHRAEHRAALEADPRSGVLRTAGAKLVLHSWGKHGARGKRKVWTLYEEELTTAGIEAVAR